MHAFPRCWRAGLISETHISAGMRDGALSLLGSIMEKDRWRITFSGDSLVSTSEGIPEGSKYGPACFNLLPNILVKELLGARCGISFSAKVPHAWADHVWTGRGFPESSTVQDILCRLQHDKSLPGIELMRKDCNLEASCARALDLHADLRVPVLFHADDPVFLASSRGEANRVLALVSSWDQRFKVTLHLSDKKTVALTLPFSSASSALHSSPLRYDSSGQGLPSPISWASSQKWLGLLWNDVGDFGPHARKCCGSCHSSVQALCSLVSGRRIPLVMACLIFDLKIEPALKFGRWLWGVHEDSLAVLTESYNSWARMLLGSSRRRSAEVCRGELGWEFCAPARVALEVAAARHALWLQNGESLAGLCFAQAHLLQSNNWAKASLQLLEKWSVLDWPVWASCRRAHPTYQLYVRETVQYSSTLAWKAAVAKHTLPLCYLALCDAPSSQLRAAFKLNMAWASLLGQRDLLLLRCGFIRLGHIDHRPSRAAILRCIFCDRRYSSIHSHVVCRCSHFETCRCPCMPCDSLSILNVQPGAPLFEQVVVLASCICSEARQFWRLHGYSSES